MQIFLIKLLIKKVYFFIFYLLIISAAMLSYPIDKKSYYCLLCRKIIKKAAILQIAK